MGYYDSIMNQQMNPQMMNAGYQNGYSYYNNFMRPTQNQPMQSVQPVQPVQPVQQIQQPQLPPQEVMKVNGKNGVDMLNMAPNSSLLVLDISKPLVWFIQTDGAGYKTPTPYKIIPYTEEEENVDSKVMTAIYNLDARLSTLEGMVNNATNEQQSNSQHDAGVSDEPAKSSSTKSTKSKRSNDADV